MARNLPFGEIDAGCVMLAQNPSPGGGRIAACTASPGVSEVWRVRSKPTATPSSATSAAKRSHRRHGWLVATVTPGHSGLARI